MRPEGAVNRRRPTGVRPARWTFLLLMAVGIGAVAIACGRQRLYGRVLDDFEGPFRLDGWSFDAGTEFRGARGRFRIVPGEGYKGSRGGVLSYDFSDGGRYVQALYPLPYRGSIDGVRLRVRGDAGQELALRIRDTTGQVFQKTVGVIPARWTDIDIPFRDWDESFGGPDDGVLRMPPISLALMVVHTGPTPQGAMWIDDLRRIRGARDSSRVLRLQPHPRLTLSQRDLRDLRRRIRRSGVARAAFESLQRECDRELRASIQVPRRGGQVEHWYACPTHGARLETKSGGRHVCPIDGRVYRGEPYDSVVVALKHKRLRRLAPRFATLYAITRDERWLRATRSILLTYADLYRNLPLHDLHGAPGRGARVWAQPLDESVWLVAMLQAADLIWTDLSPGERKRVETGFIRPALEDVIRPAHLRIHNIQCWHNAAIGLAGYLLGDQRLIREAIDGVRGIRSQLARGVNQDGQWLEGSWGYHFYALYAMTHLAEAARLAGDDLYRGPLRSMFTAPLRAAMPDGSLPPFNDAPRLDLAERDIYELGLRRFGDPAMAAPLLHADRTSLRALLYGVDPLPKPPRSTPASVSIMADSGYAILRKGEGADAAWICVKYGPYGGDHGHLDKNSLIAYRRGRMILDDPGVGAYLTNLPFGWYKTTLAHNALVVEGQNQAPGMGRLLATLDADAALGALTDAGPATGPIRHRRAAVLLGDGLLAVVDLMRAEDGRSRWLDLVWHPEGRWVSRQGSPLSGDQRPGYRYLRDLRRASGRTAYTVWFGDRPAGDRRRAVRMVTDQRAELITGTGVGASTEDRTPIAILRRRAESAAVLTLISLDPADRAPIGSIDRCVTAGGKTIPMGQACWVTVVDGSRRHRIVVNPDGFPIRDRAEIIRRQLDWRSEPADGSHAHPRGYSL